MEPVASWATDRILNFKWCQVLGERRWGQGATIEEKRGGTSLQKTYSEKLPTKGRHLGGDIENETEAKPRIQGTAFHTGNSTQAGKQHTRWVCWCSWRAVTKQGVGVLQGQPGPISRALEWDWGFTVREQAATDRVQSDMIWFVVLYIGGGCLFVLFCLFCHFLGRSHGIWRFPG